MDGWDRMFDKNSTDEGSVWRLRPPHPPTAPEVEPDASVLGSELNLPNPQLVVALRQLNFPTLSTV